MDPILLSLAGGVITTLLGVVAILWKDSQKWQSRFMSERNKRIEDSKDHYRTSEMFLLALEKRRRVNSEPPRSNR